MSEALSYRTSVQVLLRDRLLDAARALIEENGWVSVTMGKIAARVGVSRQTVYNELGTKHNLAEQLTLRELARFLEEMQAKLIGHETVSDAIHAACLAVLTMAEESLLVRTILTSMPGEQDTDFLKILTTESGEIVEAATMMARQVIDVEYPNLPLTEREKDVAIESIVRLILSAITRPSKSAAESANEISWMINLALAGAEARAGEASGLI